MPGSSTTPGRSDLAMVRPKRVAFRARNSVGARGLAFAAQWLAYALPWPRSMLWRLKSDQSVAKAVPALRPESVDMSIRGR